MATITGTIVTAGNVPFTGTITFSPLERVKIIGGAEVTGADVESAVVSGALSVELLEGPYTVIIPETTKFRIQVPTGAGPILIDTIIVSGAATITTVDIALPSGGLELEPLVKSSDSDFAVRWNGESVPTPTLFGGRPDLVISGSGSRTSATAALTRQAVEYCLQRYGRVHFPRGNWGLDRGVYLWQAYGVDGVDSIKDKSIRITADPGTYVGLVDATLARRGEGTGAQVELPNWLPGVLWSHDDVFNYAPSFGGFDAVFYVSIAADGTTATATSETAHALKVGDRFRVQLSSDDALNNNNTGWAVLSVPSPTTFTFAVFDTAVGTAYARIIPHFPPWADSAVLDLGGGSTLDLNSANRPTKYAADRAVITIPPRAFTFAAKNVEVRGFSIVGMGPGRGAAYGQPETFVGAVGTMSHMPNQGRYCFVPAGYTLPIVGETVEVTVDTPEICVPDSYLYQQGAGGYVKVVSRDGHTVVLESLFGGPTGHPLNPGSPAVVAATDALILPELAGFTMLPGATVEDVRFIGPIAPQTADDFKLALASLTHVGTTATATTVNAHGFPSGSVVTIEGADQAQYNGDQTLTATAANTFQFEMLSNPGVDATGTITAEVDVDDYRPEMSMLIVAGTGRQALRQGNLIRNVGFEGLLRNATTQLRDTHCLTLAGTKDTLIDHCWADDVGGSFYYSDAHVNLGVKVKHCRTRCHASIHLAHGQYGFQTGVDPHELKWHGPWWDLEFRDNKWEDRYCTGSQESGLALVFGSSCYLGYTGGGSPRPAFGQMAYVDRCEMVDNIWEGYELPFWFSSISGYDIAEFLHSDEVELYYKANDNAAQREQESLLQTINQGFLYARTARNYCTRKVSKYQDNSQDAIVPYFDFLAEPKVLHWYMSEQQLPERVVEIPIAGPVGSCFFINTVLIDDAGEPYTRVDEDKLRLATMYTWEGGALDIVLPQTEDGGIKKVLTSDSLGGTPAMYRIAVGEKIAFQNKGAGIITLKYISAISPYATGTITTVAPGTTVEIIADDSVPAFWSPTGGGVPEAPIDATPYARQDASWVALAGGGDMLKATYDPSNTGLVIGATEFAAGDPSGTRDGRRLYLNLTDTSLWYYSSGVTWYKILG